MSTYLYLTCLDHNPPLTADEESGRHLYDLPQIRYDIADRKWLVERSLTDYGIELGYFRNRSVRFLGQHANCNIGITDEYGVEHEVTA